MMPVKRRIEKIRRQDLEELTREQRRTLWYGRGFFPEPAFKSDDDFAAAWEIHRDAILPEWIAAHPGTRPAGWWRFDAPDRHPPYIDPADEGRYPPRALKVVAGELVRVTEAETDYLRRKGLLTANEVVVVESKFLF